MGNIVLLDDLTINKIAAGEVIERPASVVKELVENSIDAGANNIVVEIKGGGISLIRITDNGKGIPADDLDIAFERHATSKIRVADDLEEVKTMGFRGEALASIAAIANVEMMSKTKDSDIGNKIIVEGGKVLEKCEIGCQNGTTINVQNLFFNTPVRYKFLKKDYTESGYIEDIITRLALINSNIAFKLINDGKTIIQTTGNGEMKSVIYSIYGKDVAEGILNVDYTYEDIKVTGVVGKPEIARSNRTNQLFFVNGRYVKDKTLSSGTEQAFKGMLPIGKFGFLILNVELAPSKVDVNVHPAKLEVRFSEDSKVFKAIYHSIKETLLKGDLVANTEIKEDNYNNTDNIEQEKINTVEEIKFKEPTKNVFSNLFKKKPDVLKEETEKFDDERTEENNFIAQIYNKRNETEENVVQNEKEKDEEEPIINTTATTPNEEKVDMATKMIMKQTIEDIEKENENFKLKEMINKMDNINSLNEEQLKDFENMYVRTFGTMPVKEKEEDNTLNATDIIEKNVSMFEKQDIQVKPQYKFIGIVFSTYIIIELDKEMYIIDQHAAHERIMYEKVKENFYNQENKDSQLMLLPDVITLTHKEMDIVKENIEMFKKAGFMLEEFGDNTIKLTGVPNICMELDTKELFVETLDAINTVAITALQEKEEKFIATIACKAAVKANMSLTKEEVDNLMDNLLKLPNPFTCPHGRPTAIKMNKNDIEKKFARR